MEAGGSSNGGDGREGLNPPDETQDRLKGAAGAPRFQPDEAENPGNTEGLIGSGFGARGPDQGPAAAFGDSGPRQGPASAFGSSGLSEGPASPFAPAMAANQGDVDSRSRPWSEPAPAASGPIRCHFLRSVGPDGKLTDAQKGAVPTHRCAAFGEPLPLSLRQQELVCLQRVHVSCPRYVRGTVLANETAPETEAKVEKVGFPLMTVAAAVLVVAALGILFTGPILGVFPFGGAHSPAAVTNESPSATLAVTPAPTVRITLAPTPAPTRTATSTIVATATPAATPTATPAPTVAANSSWPPGATADRMNQLTPCTNQANCYIYIVQKGNVLAAIANYFGVDLATVRQMNGLGNSNNIVTGEPLKIPPPTK